MVHNFTTFVLIPLILSIGLVPISLADHHMIISPRQQMEDGIAAEDVVCKSGLALMIRPSGDAACVKEVSVKKLEGKDWKLEKEATMMDEGKHFSIELEDGVGVAGP